MGNHPKNKSSGFMLIELAVVVGIVALIAAGALAAMKIHIAGKVVNNTKDNLATIKAAMAVYKKEHGRFPCPASMTAAPGSMNFGVQAAQTAAAPGIIPEPLCATVAPAAGTWRAANPDATGAVNNNVRIGAVPFATLGISSEASVDGWGNRFLYAVSESLADNTIPYADTNGAIKLVDNNNTVMGPNPDHAPFVLISMGQKGLGGYTLHGVPRGGAPCPTTGPQMENCDMTNAIFRSMAYSNVTDPNQRFDNIVSNDLGAADPSRICGDQGMIFGPGHPMADAQGCVTSLQVDTTGNTDITGNANITGAATIDGGANITGATNITGTTNITGSTGVTGVLAVSGEVRVGNAGTLCDGTTNIQGAIRYNAGVMEFCSPTGWAPLIGGTAGGGGSIPAISCPAGEFLTGITATGAPICLAPTASPPPTGGSCGTQADGSTWTTACPAPQTGTQDMVCTAGVTSVTNNSRCMTPPACVNVGTMCMPEGAAISCEVYPSLPAMGQFQARINGMRLQLRAWANYSGLGCDTGWVTGSRASCVLTRNTGVLTSSAGFNSVLGTRTMTALPNGSPCDPRGGTPCSPPANCTRSW